jgi:UDP-N-acetylmuramyl pentapeptide phosphotransferase/UDP-N-acetylglucosamine-1-phosphate transferase
MTALFASTSLINCLILALVVALLGCMLTVLTSSLHGRFTLDSAEGVQRSHTKPTPRVGGLPIMLGLLCAAPLADEEIRSVLYPALFASVPAFAFGLAEDLTKRVGALQRLLATMASGVLGWMITGVSLTSVGLSWVDQFLAVSGLSVLFTAFSIGGIANAVNLIDGLNGMASGFVVLALIAVASVATSTGDTSLAQTAMVIAAAYAGFFLLNWPLGKIFLGDGGAYSGGFFVAWLCVLLVQRNDSVSPFAALLICIYPVTETFCSILRRLKQGMSISHPDSMHLHNLIHNSLVSHLTGRLHVANSLSGITMTVLSAPSAILVSSFYKNEAICAALCIAFTVFYLVAYLTLGKQLIIEKSL